MPEYLISFNDEWVPEHTAEQIQAKGVASRAVVTEMQEQGVLLFSNGGLDRDTILFNVVGEGGRAMFTDGPYVETKEHLGGFCAIDVPDDETAAYWAGRLAEVLEWPQEVHRFRGAGMGGGAGASASRSQATGGAR